MDKKNGGPNLNEAKLSEDMKNKLAKARAQEGWSDEHLRHNAAADKLATRALEAGLPHSTEKSNRGRRRKKN